MSTIEYAQGTYITTHGSWGTYGKARALCSDGVVRTTKRMAQSADTFFSVPCAVSVKGKTVSGYISVESVAGYDTVTDDDPAIVRFHAYKYGKNGDLL